MSTSSIFFGVLERARRAFVPAALLALAALFVFRVWHGGELAPVKGAPRPAPAIALQTTDGRAVSLASLRGHPVLVNFWATWCPACRVELGDLEKLSRAAPGCLQVVGVAVDSGSPADVADFARSHGLTYPILIDDGTAGRAYRVAEIPRSVLIDAEGRLVGELTGTISPAGVAKAVAALPGQPGC